jgi:hypothetical protein
MTPPRWRDVEKSAGRFMLRYRPSGWPVLLSTRVDLVLEPASGGTVIRASTTSQRVITGDTFNMYEAILVELGGALSRSSEEALGRTCARIA